MTPVSSVCCERASSGAESRQHPETLRHTSLTEPDDFPWIRTVLHIEKSSD